MKESTYRTYTATACGVFAFAAAVWMLAAMMSGYHLAVIPLGLVFAFCVTCCRIQLHDRHIAKIKEDWRRN